MLRRYYPSVWLLLLALAGCRTQPYVNAHIESVNAEYRQLEDYVYGLEEENARLAQENNDLRRRAAGSSGASQPTAPPRGGLFRRGREATPGSAAPDMQRRTTPGSTAEPPTIEIPGSESPPRTPSGRSTLQRPALGSPAELSAPSDTPPSLAPPSIELPPPTAPTPGEPKNAAPPASEGILPLPAAPSSRPAPKAAEPIQTKPADTKVTHLFLNPLFTGGADFDGQPGDEGLSVVLEPRNAGDQYVPQAGSVSVVVLDPMRQGDAARIARWDFDLSATEQLLEAPKAARGIKLEMPWPAAAPASSRLKLFVRYETADGRRLQTDREIFVTPPGQVTHRWTPRPAERQRAAVASAPTLPPAVAIKSEERDATVSTGAPTSLVAPPASLSGDPTAGQRLRPVWSPNR